MFANKRVPSIDIFVNKQPITKVYETKFLGVIFAIKFKVAHTYKFKRK